MAKFENQLDNAYGHKRELWEAAKAEARRVLVEIAKAGSVRESRSVTAT
jgi:hypothetical protein